AHIAAPLTKSRQRQIPARRRVCGPGPASRSSVHSNQRNQAITHPRLVNNNGVVPSRLTIGYKPHRRSQGDRTIFPPMSKPTSRSALYRLIEAGQLAHQAVLVPLVEKGLEPGDDAILFVLGRSGTTEEELSRQLGLSGEALVGRLARLAGRDLITRQAVGPELVPGYALTERGAR